MPKRVRKWKVEVEIIDDSYEMRCGAWNGFWTNDDIRKEILSLLEQVDLGGIKFKRLKIRRVK